MSENMDTPLSVLIRELGIGHVIYIPFMAKA